MKAFKTALKVIAVAAAVAAMTISGIEKDGKRIFVGSFSGDHIRFSLSIVIWVCITALLVMFLRERREDNAEKPKNSRSVLAVLATLFDVVLTFAILFTLIFIRLDKPVRVESPDGKHYIVRVETNTLFGKTKYNFYMKEKGVKYRYIFDNETPDPELEWTDSGVKFRSGNILFKY